MIISVKQVFKNLLLIIVLSIAMKNGVYAANVNANNFMQEALEVIDMDDSLKVLYYFEDKLFLLESKEDRDLLLNKARDIKNPAIYFVLTSLAKQQKYIPEE